MKTTKNNEVWEMVNFKAINSKAAGNSSRILKPN